MSFFFIVWIILTVLLLLYPIALVSKYGGVVVSGLFSYVYRHIQDIKGLRQFHAGDVMKTIREIDRYDATKIFDDAGQSESTEEDSLASEQTSIEKSLSDTAANHAIGSEGLLSSDITTDELIEQSLHKELQSYSITDESKLEQQRNRAKIETLKGEALTLKNRGQFEDYEKKLIEGMGLEINEQAGYFKKELADWYFHMGNYNKSLTLLKQILITEPRNHRALWQVGEIHLEKGEFDLAKVLIEKAIELSPHNPKYYVSLVEVLYNMDEVDSAIAIMLKVVKLRPKNSSYLLGLAGLYEKLNDDAEAKTVYMKILQLDPANEKARKKLKLFN